MSSLATQHPEDGLLLQYIDGELSGRKGRQVEGHLRACWQCRTEMEELEETVASCMRYRKNVLQTYLPDPPNPWPDLYREFARIDSSASVESHMVVKQLASRFLGALGRATVRRWAFGAVAALVMVCAVWYQFRETPSVQAAALLKRAVLAADSQASPARRVIQIRTKSQKLTRTLGGRRATAAEAAASPLQARLQAAHFDWEDPLSAKSYQGWRAAAVVKEDVVTDTADSFRIRTVAADGDLASASLVLRATDLRPMEERLEFRDQEWVELSDITDATTRDDGAPVATNVEPPVRPAVPSRLAATSSGPALISEELQVLSALHEIGADLGDPVEVGESGGRVVVAGVGISQERQRQIREKLSALAGVSIQFSEPAAGEPVATAPTEVAGAGVPPVGFQARVEKQLGGHAEFERFSARVLDGNEALMARAYALRRLAERFSKDEALTGNDREVLRVMARQHAAALAKEVDGMEQALRPLLTAMGGTAGNRSVRSHAAWQPATEELFHASHRVDVLVSVLLGVTPGSVSSERLPSDLLSAIGELRADLDSCQRLLKQ